MTDRSDHRLAQLIAALVPAPEAWVRRAEQIALQDDDGGREPGDAGREPHEPDA